MDDVAVMAVFDELVFHFLVGHPPAPRINSAILGAHMFNPVNSDDGAK